MSPELRSVYKRTIQVSASALRRIAEENGAGIMLPLLLKPILIGEELLGKRYNSIKFCAFLDRHGQSDGRNLRHYIQP